MSNNQDDAAYIPDEELENLMDDEQLREFKEKTFPETKKKNTEDDDDDLSEFDHLDRSDLPLDQGNPIDALISIVETTNEVVDVRYEQFAAYRKSIICISGSNPR